jgi:small-conductance mechanosensitive channel
MQWWEEPNVRAAVASVAVVVVASVASFVVGRVASSRLDDGYRAYYARKVSRYAFTMIAIVLLIVIWLPFGGQLLGALAIVSAGVAFAMQEVIGAFAGWFNITLGRIFRVGDRIKMGGVHGDVIDISLMRTKLVEIGSAVDDQSWVKGRQPTGRIVTVSNKRSFTDPVYNYSDLLDFVWDEFVVEVPQSQDWEQARTILEAAVAKVTSVGDARELLKRARRKLPIPTAEMKPRVFASPHEAYVVLTARYVLPLRTSRVVKDQLTTDVHSELKKAGISLVASTVVELGETDDEQPPPS